MLVDTKSVGTRVNGVGSVVVSGAKLIDSGAKIKCLVVSENWYLQGLIKIVTVFDVVTRGQFISQVI